VILIIVELIVLGVMWIMLKHARRTYVDDKDGERMYVSIGDSIARGYGLSDIEHERYSALLCDLLNQTGDKYTEYNYGIDGQTSGELLDSIKSGSILELSDADIVTICIGTNDVLASAEDFFSKYEKLFYYYGDAPGNRQLVNECWNIYEKRDFVVDYYNMVSKTQKGITEFQDNFAEIINQIRNINPDCRIICITVYNPYANFDYSITADDLQVNMAEYSDDTMNSMNGIIRSMSEELSFDVAEVHDAFANAHEDVLNSGVSIYGINLDDHPNKAGHQLIAEVIYNQIENGDNNEQNQ
jgi:lysophospholipase L1-like esterase